jgi:hypothetical protein
VKDPLKLLAWAGIVTLLSYALAAALLLGSGCTVHQPATPKVIPYPVPTPVPVPSPSPSPRPCPGPGPCPRAEV